MAAFLAGAFFRAFLVAVGMTFEMRVLGFEAEAVRSGFYFMKNEEDARVEMGGDRIEGGVEDDCS